MLIDKNMFKLFETDDKGGGAAAADTEKSGASSQGDDKSEGTTTDDKSKGSDKEGDGILDIDEKHVKVDKDGQLVYTAGESIYKGKDINELLDNISNGIVEKDSVIKKSKVREAVKLPDGFKDRKGDDNAPEVVLRTREEVVGEIAPKVIRSLGVDPKMMNWTEAQWDKFAEDEGLRDYKIMELRASVKEARKEINRQVEEVLDTETRKVAIAQVIDEEHEEVVEALGESPLPQEILDKHFDYAEILARVTKNKDNYNQYGNLKSGRIVAEVSKVLRKLEREHMKPAMQKKIEEDVERGTKVKARIPSAGAGSEHRNQPKALSSYEDVVDAAKKEHGLK